MFTATRVGLLGAFAVLVTSGASVFAQSLPDCYYIIKTSRWEASTWIKTDLDSWTPDDWFETKVNITSPDRIRIGDLTYSPILEVWIDDEGPSSTSVYFTESYNFDEKRLDRGEKVRHVIRYEIEGVPDSKTYVPDWHAFDGTQTRDVNPSQTRLDKLAEDIVVSHQIISESGSAHSSINRFTFAAADLQRGIRAAQTSYSEINGQYENQQCLPVE